MTVKSQFHVIFGVCRIIYVHSQSFKKIVSNQVKTEEMANKTHYIVLDNRPVKIDKIAKIVNISDEHVFNTMHYNLDMGKVLAK